MISNLIGCIIILTSLSYPSVRCKKRQLSNLFSTFLSYCNSRRLIDILVNNQKSCDQLMSSFLPSISELYEGSKYFLQTKLFECAIIVTRVCEYSNLILNN